MNYLWLMFNAEVCLLVISTGFKSDLSWLKKMFIINIYI